MPSTRDNLTIRGTAAVALALVSVLASACDRSDGSAAATSPTPVAEGGAPAPEAPVPSEAQTISAARLQRSIELEQQGDLEAARVEAEAAVAAGGGRDATLQLAKLAILGNRHDDAAALLQPLVDADPNDAGALYDLALVRQRQGDYNRARSGYLATLRADARYADARYNLAWLCHDHGFADEAKHHVEKFRIAFPDDPRGPELERRIAGTGVAGPTGAGTPSSASTPSGSSTPTPAPAPVPTPVPPG